MPTAESSGSSLTGNRPQTHSEVIFIFDCDLVLKKGVHLISISSMLQLFSSLSISHALTDPY